MIILDSSIWISFFNEDDNQHKKAKKIFRELNRKVVLLPEYIIIEVSTVLTRKKNKKTANKFLELSFNNKDVRILLSDNIFFREVVEYFKTIPNKNLSFIDISLLYLSKSYDIKTFDQKLARAIKNIR